MLHGFCLLPVRCHLVIFVNSLTGSNIVSVFVVSVFPGLVMKMVPSADLATR